MGIFDRWRRTPNDSEPTGIEVPTDAPTALSDAAQQAVGLAAAAGDDSAAALVRAFATDPALAQRWAAAIEAGDHPKWADRFDVPASLPERWLLELLSLSDTDTEGERLLLGLRVALSKRTHLREIDWKAGLTEAESALDTLFGAHDLAESTPAERDAQETAWTDANEVTDEFPGLAARAAERGHALALLDINSDSYVMVLLHADAAPAWNGVSIDGTLSVQIVEPKQPVAMKAPQVSTVVPSSSTGSARALHRTSAQLTEQADYLRSAAAQIAGMIEAAGDPDDAPRLHNLMFDDRLKAIIASYSAGTDVADIDREVAELLTDGLHMAPKKPQYEWVLQMLSLAILCRVDDELIDVIRQFVDGGAYSELILDTLLASRFADRECNPKVVPLRPYNRLPQIIEIDDADARVAALGAYVDEQWYRGHKARRAPWIGTHEPDRRNDYYFGYWSFESGALAVIWGLDDEPLREFEHYPADLVRPH